MLVIHHTVERGRPEYAIGSHAYGENYHMLGIHLSGDFEKAYPTQAMSVLLKRS